MNDIDVCSAERARRFASLYDMSSYIASDKAHLYLFWWTALARRQWRSQPKRSGWVRKVGLPRQPLRGGVWGGGFAPLPNLENFGKMKPILPSFRPI